MLGGGCFRFRDEAGGAVVAWRFGLENVDADLFDDYCFLHDFEVCGATERAEIELVGEGHGEIGVLHGGGHELAEKVDHGA